MPSVVAITSTAVYQSRDFGYDWFFGGGLGGQTYEVPSSGSGIIIGENETELLIVTNNHVVEEATSLKVTFIDEETNLPHANWAFSTSDDERIDIMDDMRQLWETRMN